MCRNPCLFSNYKCFLKHEYCLKNSSLVRFPEASITEEGPHPVKRTGSWSSPTLNQFVTYPSHIFPLKHRLPLEFPTCCLMDSSAVKTMDNVTVGWQWAVSTGCGSRHSVGLSLLVQQWSSWPNDGGPLTPVKHTQSNGVKAAGRASAGPKFAIWQVAFPVIHNSHQKHW